MIKIRINLKGIPLINVYDDQTNERVVFVPHNYSNDERYVEFDAKVLNDTLGSAVDALKNTRDYILEEYEHE